MEPMTFIIWMWLTWGAARLFFPGDTSPEADTALVDAEGDEQPDSPGFWKRVTSGGDNARNTEWGNPGWWAGALLGAALAPLRDIRKGAAWANRKRKGADPAPTDLVPAATSDQPEARDSDGEPETGKRDQPCPETTPGSEDGDKPHQDPRPNEEPAADRPEPYDIEVEVIRAQPNTPPTPELNRPPRSLTAGDPDQADPPKPDDFEVEVTRTQPNTPTTPELGQTPRSLAAGDPDPARADTPEGTDMAGNYVAVPGSSGVARNAGGGLLATGGATHDDAKDFARKIVAAMDMTADPVEQAAAMLAISLKAAWAAVEGLEAVGIRGPVQEGWCEAVVEFEVALQTAKVLVQQVTDARLAAAAAGRLQARTGDTIQDAIIAAAGGKSAARDTSYYGKH